MSIIMHWASPQRVYCGRELFLRRRCPLLTVTLSVQTGAAGVPPGDHQAYTDDPNHHNDDANNHTDNPGQSPGQSDGITTDMSPCVLSIGHYWQLPSPH